MRASIELLRSEPRARLFFATHLQSCVGSGIGFVALLVVAYDRAATPWIITVVLLADFLPSMVFGPLFGALSDRWSRRGCAVLGDAMRAVAFIGIGVLGGSDALIALALVAGVGTGLFLPAVTAALPALVHGDREAPATALFGSIVDLGMTAGPALAAAGFLVVGAKGLLIANGVTFAVSAAVLATLPLDASENRAAPGDPSSSSLLGELREGLRAITGHPDLRAILLAAAAALLFGAAVNVGELILVKEELGGAAASYALLVSSYGVGSMLGSLSGARERPPPTLRRLFLAGLLCEGIAIVASGASPSVLIAGVTFAATGYGSGMALVYERLLIYQGTTDALRGRVFGFRDALNSWAFAAAFVGAGAVASTLGARPLFFLSGVAALLVWAFASLALRAGTDDGLRAVAEESRGG